MCSINVIVPKFALLEAEFLLRRAVTIVRDTSAINSSRSLMIQSMCMVETRAKPGIQLV